MVQSGETYAKSGGQEKSKQHKQPKNDAEKRTRSLLYSPGSRSRVSMAKIIRLSLKKNYRLGIKKFLTYTFLVDLGG